MHILFNAGGMLLMVRLCNYKGSSSPFVATSFVFLRNRTAEPPQEVCGGGRA